MKSFTIRVPASTANLGPAFDCLGLALDLWNESHFEIEAEAFSISVSGEGQNHLPLNSDNLIIQSMQYLYRQADHPFPEKLALTCQNQVPLNSGLGSSSTAVVAGLLAANHMLGAPFSKTALLRFAVDIEGHADNAAAALYGGLVLLTEDQGEIRPHPIKIQELNCLIILPDINLSTLSARSILPKNASLQSAVFNISHAMWLLETFKSNNLEALRLAMQDQLHQVHRLAHLPGADEALLAANRAGVAAALSGAGPSLIAFIDSHRKEELSNLLKEPFTKRGISTRIYKLKNSQKGAEITK